MNNKHEKKIGKSGQGKSYAFNTGLADALGSISLESSPSSTPPKKGTALRPELISDCGVSQRHIQRTPENRQAGMSASDITAEWIEAFGKSEMTEPNGYSSSVAKPCASDLSSATEEELRYLKCFERVTQVLPSKRLMPKSELPDWENTSNFVFVRFKKCEYAYPIHGWISIMERCESMYKECDDIHLIRKESRQAIAGVIQGCCDRGSFDNISFGLIERKVCKRLSKMYKERLGIQKKIVLRNERASEEIRLQQSAQLASESRARAAYLARDFQEASKVRTSNRINKYIDARAKRVGDSAKLSLPGAFTNKMEDARTVRIGLDFGTQNLKVAFRDSDEDQAVILELNPSAHGIGRFMISPVISVEGDRIVQRVSAEPASFSWKHALSFYYGNSFAKDDKDIRLWLDGCIKQNSVFAKRSPQEWVLFFASVHIAFQLGTVGCAVREYYRDKSITDDLRFRVFMCVPVATWDQQFSSLIFQDCLTLADEMHGLLDFTSGDIAVQDALVAYDEASQLGVLLKPRLDRRSRIVPEVLAEIASYAQSRAAREGVYALVDIGAGTLDLNVFKVLTTIGDEGVRTPVFAAACHANGVKHLESLLGEVLGENSVLSEHLIEEQKKLQQFPDIDALTKAYDHAHNLDFYSRLEDAHKFYCVDVAQQTRITWAEAWKKRGLERKPWQELTMFLCGGGASIREIQKHLKAGMPAQIIQCISHKVLPCPSEEEFKRPAGFPEEEFHRVAVAYGLTFGPEIESTMILPSQVSSVRIRRKIVDIESDYISKDMV